MSLEQYKDANREELWEILQIQSEEFRKMNLERNIRDLEQRAIGIADTAIKMNNIYVDDHNLKAVPTAQFSWWNRCFKYMVEEAERIKTQAKALSDAK